MVWFIGRLGAQPLQAAFQNILATMFLTSISGSAYLQRPPALAVIFTARGRLVPRAFKTTKRPPRFRGVINA